MKDLIHLEPAMVNLGYYHTRLTTLYREAQPDVVMTNEIINARLGNIIKIIANNPGIALTRLHKALVRSGHCITERTLAKDILALKEQYHLLEDKPRLRSGYVLQDMITLSQSDMSLVLDMMHIFGVRLNDPDATNLAERMLPLLDQSVSGSSQSKAWSEEKSPGVPSTRPHMRSIRQRNIYGNKPDSSRTQEILLQAIRLRMPVAITYSTPRAQKPKSVRGYPLLMIFHERGWYCLMRDLNKLVYAPRRVDRIQAINILQSSPTNTRHLEDVSDAEFLVSCGWGMTFPQSLEELKQADAEAPIIVRFDRTVAPFILESTDRHPRGQVSAATDGTGDAVMKIRLANPAEFLHWVRSFGSHARVVAPPHIAASESAEIKRMAERYAKA